MALLAGVNYDPAAAVSKATSSRIAMTAFDTTNLRLSFTVPDNGCVLVRIRCNLSGATTFPSILLGVLQSTTIIGRVSPVGAIPGTAVATTNVSQEAVFSVSGLTPAASLTWDAAYGVEILLAATNIHYGGPDNNTTNNAWGGLSFEVWEAPNLLGVKNYDPAVAVSKSTATDIIMTALDTTNLRIAFTVPGSGKVWCRLKGTLHGATTFPQVLLGVMDGATVKGRTAGMGGLKETALATARLAIEGEFLVTGLTPGASLSYDAAYGVETPIASTGLKYGGPDNTTTDDAFGAFQFEIWEA